MSSEINQAGVEYQRSDRVRAGARTGTNLQADHGEEEAVSVQEVEHLGRTRVSSAGAIAMGGEKGRGLTAG